MVDKVQYAPGVLHCTLPAMFRFIGKCIHEPSVGVLMIGLKYLLNTVTLAMAFTVLEYKFTAFIF